MGVFFAGLERGYSLADSVTRMPRDVWQMTPKRGTHQALFSSFSGKSQQLGATGWARGSSYMHHPSD